MKRFIVILIVVITAITGYAQTIVRKGSVAAEPDSLQLVIVGNDTVNAIIPERNFGRFDRGLYNYIFIPRGKWGFGISANYGELNTEDIQILSLIKDINFQGKIYSVKPYVSYWFRNNQSAGLRVNYTNGSADLGRLAVDFDDDINFTLRDVRYTQESLSFSAFYRNYIGLDKNGRFAVFNEVDLEVGRGVSTFHRLYNDEPKLTRTVSTKAALNFSPGLCVFIQDYVSFNVSFGVFGLKMGKEKQTTNDVEEGSRFSSGANFRFNVFNINFGLMVVI